MVDNPIVFNLHTKTISHPKIEEPKCFTEYNLVIRKIYNDATKVWYGSPYTPNDEMPMDCNFFIGDNNQEYFYLTPKNGWGLCNGYI